MDANTEFLLTELHKARRDNMLRNMVSCYTRELGIDQVRPDTKEICNLINKLTNNGKEN